MNVFSIDFTEQTEALMAIKKNVPAAVAYAVEQVGVEGVQKFFDGYKDCPELEKLAA
ncbi:MAG: hypothetical protein KIS62_03130 [Ramlibacter sp.]|nr:hypothetical protein [Ramlibacter sp.]